MTPRGSKTKGSNYEREVAAWLNERVLGLSARRALLSGGGRNDGGADLDGTPHVHMELKRTERFAPRDAMRQAEDAISRAGGGPMPVVVTRSNREGTGESLVVMRLADWVKLYRLLHASKEADNHLFVSRNRPHDSPSMNAATVASSADASL